MEILPLFSSLHNTILCIIVMSWVIIPILGKQLNKNQAQAFAVRLAFLILFLEFYLFIYRQTLGIFDPTKNIPLHLCSFAEICSAYALITKNQRAFELAFYWSFAGSIQALITPNLTDYNLFDTQFIIFFLSHGLIILNVIWLIHVDNMKVQSISYLKVFFITNLIAIPIGLIDWLTESNYLYLRSKPPVSNPLLLGEWPWYILGFEVIALIFFIILFIIMKICKKVN